MRRWNLILCIAFMLCNVAANPVAVESSIQRSVLEEKPLVYGGVVLPKKPDPVSAANQNTQDEKGVTTIMKLLKLHGTDLPSRIMSDEERHVFEIVTFRLLEESLICWGRQDHQDIPGCKIKLVRVESQSLIEEDINMEIKTNEKENGIELIVTVKAYMDDPPKDVGVFETRLVDALLEKLVWSLNSRNSFKTLDGEVFDHVESLDVYEWKNSNGNVASLVSENPQTHSGYNYRLEEGTSLRFSEGIQSTPNQAISSMQSNINEGAFIFQSGLVACVVIVVAFTVVISTVLFLRRNSVVPPVEFIPFNDTNNMLNTDNQNEFFDDDDTPITSHHCDEMPRRAAVTKSVRFKGVMDDEADEPKQETYPSEFRL